MAHVENNSGNNEWYTPRYIIDLARQVMGSIDLDPASSERANEVVQATTFYTQAQNGLLLPWFGNVWHNPPYSSELVSAFIDRVCEKSYAQLCCLTNNFTETNAGQRLLAIADAVCFLRARVKFLDPGTLEPKNTPLQGQMVAYLGPNAQRFAELFSPLGKVLFQHPAPEADNPLFGGNL